MHNSVKIIGNYISHRSFRLSSRFLANGKLKTNIVSPVCQLEFSVASNAK